MVFKGRWPNTKKVNFFRKKPVPLSHFKSRFNQLLQQHDLTWTRVGGDRVADLELVVPVLVLQSLSRGRFLFPQQPGLTLTRASDGCDRGLWPLIPELVLVYSPILS